MTYFLFLFLGKSQSRFWQFDPAGASEHCEVSQVLGGRQREQSEGGLASEMSFIKSYEMSVMGLTLICFHSFDLPAGHFHHGVHVLWKSQAVFEKDEEKPQDHEWKGLKALLWLPHTFVNDVPGKRCGQVTKSCQIKAGLHIFHYLKCSLIYFLSVRPGSAGAHRYCLPSGKKNRNVIFSELRSCKESIVIWRISCCPNAHISFFALAMAMFFLVVAVVLLT